MDGKLNGACDTDDAMDGACDTDGASDGTCEIDGASDGVVLGTWTESRMARLRDRRRIGRGLQHRRGIRRNLQNRKVQWTEPWTRTVHNTRYNTFMGAVVIAHGHSQQLQYTPIGTEILFDYGNSITF